MARAKHEILRNFAAAVSVPRLGTCSFVNDCRNIETPEAHGLPHLMWEALLQKV